MIFSFSILYPSVVCCDQLLGACHTLKSYHDTGHNSSVGREEDWGIDNFGVTCKFLWVFKHYISLILYNNRLWSPPNLEKPKNYYHSFLIFNQAVGFLYPIIYSLRDMYNAYNLEILVWSSHWNFILPFLKATSSSNFNLTSKLWKIRANKS